MLAHDTLRDRVALVTGGGSGIGRAIARRFAQLGAHVVVAGRKLERLEETAQELSGSGVRILPVRADVRDPEQVRIMTEAAYAAFGQIDILVNNAAAAFLSKAVDISPNGFRAVVETILHGTWLCSTSVAKGMIERGQGGAMLNIVAPSAVLGMAGSAHTAAAKAGVLNLSRSLAVEWAPHRIRVNAIAPGYIATAGAAQSLYGDGALTTELVGKVSIGRFGKADEVAEAVAFLCSDSTAYVTGALLHIDGGLSLDPGYMPMLSKDGGVCKARPGAKDQDHA